MRGIITLEKLIIEMMPFSKELVNWCEIHPDFLAALKNVYSDKFISLGAIVTSYSPNFPTDEVIGIYTYDYQRKNPIFKQDFIVNKGKLDQEFILFTRCKAGSSKFVKDINDFFATYGKGGFYVNSHHLNLEDLPGEIKGRGLDAIKLAGKMKGATLDKIPQEHINTIYRQVKLAKNSDWFVKKKIEKL
jgi:hypothetical protein